MGRFINADGFVSTGQGVLGYNMFAYCNNNPINLIDSNGTIPFADSFFADQFVELGSMIGNWLKDWFDTDRHKAQSLPYESHGKDNGAQIVDSNEITNPIIMYEYIEENRGDEISGSTAGVVSEWIVHDVAYATGELASSVGLTDVGETLMSKGRNLDVGRTIYDDAHGVFSVAIWMFYGLTSPSTAIYDLVIKIFE